MYTRSYKDGEISALPPHYDGVAFGDSVPTEKESEGTGGADALAASAPPSILSSLFGGDILRGIKIPKIGTEELLLLAAAAFLFFSKDGDKECAILILILVFLT